MTRIPNHQIGEMYSKRIRLLVKIVGFLFCTIGLLFICAKINPVRDGFQTAENTCRKIQYGGKNVWLCNEDYEARDKIRGLVDSNVLYDLVCYKTGMNVTYYTCYTRPPDKQFLPSEGIFVPGDPSDDPLPGYMDTDMDMMCTDYNIAFANFSTIYISTISLNGVISSALGEIKYAVNELSNISSTYCMNRGSYGPGVLNACTSLKTGYDNISRIPDAPYGLRFMSTTVSDSLSNMDSLYNNSFKPAYSGLRLCGNIP
jgi:hypothetical protein